MQAHNVYAAGCWQYYTRSLTCAMEKFFNVDVDSNSHARYLYGRGELLVPNEI